MKELLKKLEEADNMMYQLKDADVKDWAVIELQLRNMRNYANLVRIIEENKHGRQEL